MKTFFNAKTQFSRIYQYNSLLDDSTTVHVPYGDLVYNLKIKHGQWDQNGHSFISAFLRNMRKTRSIGFLFQRFEN